MCAAESIRLQVVSRQVRREYFIVASDWKGLRTCFFLMPLRNEVNVTEENCVSECRLIMTVASIVEEQIQPGSRRERQEKQEEKELETLALRAMAVD